MSDTEEEKGKEREERPLRPIKGQRTLMSLKKVVKLDNTTVCFSHEEITRFRTQLLDEKQTMHQVSVGCAWNFPQHLVAMQRGR